MSKLTAATLPRVPETCPPSRRMEVESARTAAFIDLLEAETREDEARIARRDAENSVRVYENLLLEVNGQGRLDL